MTIPMTNEEEEREVIIRSYKYMYRYCIVCKLSICKHNQRGSFVLTVNYRVNKNIRERKKKRRSLENVHKQMNGKRTRLRGAACAVRWPQQIAN